MCYSGGVERNNAGRTDPASRITRPSSIIARR